MLHLAGSLTHMTGPAGSSPWVHMKSHHQIRAPYAFDTTAASSTFWTRHLRSDHLGHRDADAPSVVPRSNSSKIVRPGLDPSAAHAHRIDDMTCLGLKPMTQAICTNEPENRVPLQSTGRCQVPWTFQPVTILGLPDERWTTCDPIQATRTNPSWSSGCNVRTRNWRASRLPSPA